MTVPAHFVTPSRYRGRAVVIGTRSSHVLCISGRSFHPLDLRLDPRPRHYHRRHFHHLYKLYNPRRTTGSSSYLRLSRSPPRRRCHALPPNRNPLGARCNLRSSRIRRKISPDPLQHVRRKTGGILGWTLQTALSQPVPWITAIRLTVSRAVFQRPRLGARQVEIIPRGKEHLRRSMPQRLLSDSYRLCLVSRCERKNMKTDARARGTPALHRSSTSLIASQQFTAGLPPNFART
jgi:hypothetical protein